jgi:CheY-like chemotaxis protein/nitrogen-specific signal transduction histidine kinase
VNSPNFPRTRILNVDDDEVGRYVVSRDLSREGFDVVEADTGTDALRLIKEKEIDLVVLDVKLPDISGFEVCRNIRENPRTANLPVLLLSASFVDADSKVAGLDGGADGYLTEPVEPIVLMATINSLLRLRRAERAVLEGARKWHSTFNAIQDGVALFDRTGALLQSNDAFDQIHRPMPDTLHGITSDILECLLSTRERQTVERVAGSKVLMLTMDPVLAENGEISEAVCIVSDVTERRRFEERLQHTQKLETIGVLAGGIAHDFNNLLTGILGNASLLQDELPPGAPQQELVSQILQASESAANLTSQILAYSGKGRFLLEPVDLSAVTYESLSLVRQFIPKGVHLRLDLAKDLPPIEADKGQMQQVMMNLIINAAESFGERGVGDVAVKTGVENLTSRFFEPGDPDTRPGRFVLFTVTDNGSGMDEATQKRIFDPFFTTKFVGRGLGLSAVLGIVRGHRGILRLRSRPGEGSTFMLYFPVAEGRVTPPGGVRRLSIPKATGTILVVDDEHAVRQFATYALERLGYTVLTAPNGQIAVDLFREKQSEISLVLLDYSMPVMDGAEALKHFREISPSVPIVLSSGFNQADTLERFEGKNLQGFVAKPYTPEQLRDVIASVLDR